VRSKTWVSDEPRQLGGPGFAEAMANPAHFRFSGFDCVDYGGPQDVDTQAHPPQSSRRRLRRNRCPK
jgi:hypothetical protein